MVRQLSQLLGDFLLMLMIFRTYMLPNTRFAAIRVVKFIFPWQKPKLTTHHSLILLVSVLDMTIRSAIVSVKYDNPE